MHNNLPGCIKELTKIISINATFYLHPTQNNTIIFDNGKQNPSKTKNIFGGQALHNCITEFHKLGYAVMQGLTPIAKTSPWAGPLGSGAGI